MTQFYKLSERFFLQPEFLGHSKNRRLQPFKNLTKNHSLTLTYSVHNIKSFLRFTKTKHCNHMKFITKYDQNQGIFLFTQKFETKLKLKLRKLPKNSMNVIFVCGC